MRPASARPALALVIVTALLGLPAGAARADAGAAPVPPAPAYSYEIANLEAQPDDVFVLWPRACSAAGEPLGSVDLALNPDWTARMHDVDYEVIVAGKHHEIASNCSKSSRLYALPAKAFPIGSRATTADDSELGQHVVGSAFAIVPLLDVIDRRRRIEFFEKDPRVRRSVFELAAAPSPMTEKPLRAIHDVLTVGGFTATSFVVSSKSVVYTYRDGTSETVTSPHTDALTGAEGGLPSTDANGVGKTVSTSPSSSSSSTPPSSTTPPLDIGTRWVLLAAVGGLLAGGLIAYSRKKKA